MARRLSHLLALYLIMASVCACLERGGPGAASSSAVVQGSTTTTTGAGSNQSAALNGDGQGFGGDPKAQGIIEGTRQKIVDYDTSGPDPAGGNLCRYNGCHVADDPDICLAVSQITAPQAAEIRDFVTATRAQRQTMNSDPKAPIVITYLELEVDDPEHPGQKRTVDARTTPDLTSEIDIYVGTVFATSPMTRFAILVHEMGHKVKFHNGYITDYAGTTSFPEAWGGQHFLDAAGACVAYEALHKRVSAVAIGTGGKDSPLAEVIYPGGDKNLIDSFTPFSTGSDVRVALGDVTGDGVPDLVTMNGKGNTSTIRVFSGADGSLVRTFAPIQGSDAAIAVGNVSRADRKDIIVGPPGNGGDGSVRVLDATSGTEIFHFQPYDASIAAGAQVAAADFDGDGYADIVTGPGTYGNKNPVKIFSGNKKDAAGNPKLLYSFIACQACPFSVQVAAGDVNGDGTPDVIVNTQDPNGGPSIRVFDGKSLGGTPKSLYQLGSFGGNLSVASGDVDGDGYDDMVLTFGYSVLIYSGRTGKLLPGAAGFFTPIPPPAAMYQVNIAVDRP